MVAEPQPTPASEGLDEPPARRESGIRRRVQPLDVVVAEDDASTRELLAEAITRLGHACRVANDGAHALQLLEQRRADVVVSDWDMPGMSGADLCEALRAAGDDAPYTFFMILTGFDDRDRLLRAMNAGADDYQRKPINLDELEARLVSAARVVELHRRIEGRAAELRETTKLLHAASRTDPLTGVGNRLALDEELAALLSRAQRYGHNCSLAICDIDFFKSFNDALGHVAGDETLRRVADGMRDNLRAADRLYRYGGEEFVVVLVEQTSSEAVLAMDRMRAAIEGLSIASPATGGSLTISVGVAEVDAEIDVVAEGWVSRADAALYKAKSGGRNRVVAAAMAKGR